MYILSGIVILNILAIVLLNNRLAEEHTPPPAAAPEEAVQAASPPAPVFAAPRTLVRTVVLNPDSCPDCFDIGQYISVLNGTMDMVVENAPANNVFLFRSEKLPALAFNTSIEAYPTLVEGWSEVGYKMHIPTGAYAGDWYVLPTQNAPYYATADARVHGRVTVTYITMQDCKECFDVFDLRTSLNASRITPYAERTIDAGSSKGKELIAKYNITAVPTILLDKEADAYPNLQPGWNIIGSVEEDGTYVLRDVQRLQVIYYDLQLKKLMKP
jgi:hypothetical protein